MLKYMECIVLFLFFTVVSNWVLRSVEFHWYWYRPLNVWYRDIPNVDDRQKVHREICVCQSTCICVYRAFFCCRITVNVLCVTAVQSSSV